MRKSDTPSERLALAERNYERAKRELEKARKEASHTEVHAHHGSSYERTTDGDCGTHSLDGADHRHLSSVRYVGYNHGPTLPPLSQPCRRLHRLPTPEEFHMHRHRNASHSASLPYIAVSHGPSRGQHPYPPRRTTPIYHQDALPPAVHASEPYYDAVNDRMVRDVTPHLAGRVRLSSAYQAPICRERYSSVWAKTAVPGVAVRVSPGNATRRPKGSGVHVGTPYYDSVNDVVIRDVRPSRKR